VHVVDVDGLDVEVPAAPVDLVGQVAGRHAMAMPDQLAQLEHSRTDVGVQEVGIGVGGHAAVVGNEAPLGRDHHLLARQLTRADQGPEGGADAALAALVPVVHGRVHHVEAQLE
jgi:hypothetical protein